MSFSPFVATADVPWWATVLIGLGTAVGGFLTGQRAAERDWQEKRRQLYATFTKLLARLRTDRGHELNEAKEKYGESYSQVVFAVKEGHLRDQLDQLGNADALSGENALTEEALQNLRSWFTYDMRPYVFRLPLLRRRGRPPDLDLAGARVGRGGKAEIMPPAPGPRPETSQ